MLLRRNCVRRSQSVLSCSDFLCLIINPGMSWLYRKIPWIRRIRVQIWHNNPHFKVWLFLLHHLSRLLALFFFIFLFLFFLSLFFIFFFGLSGKWKDRAAVKWVEVGGGPPGISGERVHTVDLTHRCYSETWWKQGSRVRQFKNGILEEVGIWER